MFQGVLRKMITEEGSPIKYFLNLENDFIAFNQYLNRTISLSFDGTACISCKAEKPIFRQGFCKKLLF